MSIMRGLAGKCPVCGQDGTVLIKQDADSNNPETKYQCPDGHTWYDWPKPT